MEILSEEAENCTLLYNSTFLNINTIDHWHITYCARGPQRQPLEMIIPLTIINVFIFVTGLLGNIAVCLVIVKHPKLQSATNYYLFNLAVSDLTLLVFGLPNDVAIYWHQYPYTLGEFFCKFRALLSETASYVSVLTIVAFSTERYVAICYPLYLHTMSGLQRPIRIITCLWIIGLLSAIPFAVYTGIDYVHVDVHNVSEQIQESAMCGMVSQPKYFPLIEVSTLVFFIIPMLIIAVQYSKMGISISKTAKSVRKNVNGSGSKTKRVQSNRSVIKMLTAVVMGFFLSWAPFHAQRLVTIYLQDNYYFHQIYFWMYIVTGIFYYFSSTLNPILYNVMSDRMRDAFKEVLCGIKPKQRSTKMNSTVREMSHGYVAIRNSNATTNLYLEDEKIQLVKKEQKDMIMMTPIIANKMYDVNYLERSNGNSVNPTDETNM